MRFLDRAFRHRISSFPVSRCPSLFPRSVSHATALVTCRLRNITCATCFRYVPLVAIVVFSGRICNVYDLLSLFYGLTFIVLLLPRDHTDRIADNPSNIPTNICIFNCHAQYLVLLIRRLEAFSFSARYVIQQYRESDFVSICSFIYLFA